MIYLLAFISGIFIANQTPINFKLGFILKSPFKSAFLSFVIGTAFLLLLSILQGESVAKIWQTFGDFPLWFYIGGILGTFYLTSNILLFPKLGAVQTVIIAIFGQIIASSLIDHFGLLNINVNKLTFFKIVGICLLISGIILTVFVKIDKKEEKFLIERFICFFAGVLGAFQAAINGNLANALNSSLLSAFISFLTGTILLALIVLFKYKFKFENISATKSPAWLYIGGLLGALFVSIQAFSAPKIGVSATVAFTLFGMILGSVLVSQFALWQSTQKRITKTQIIGLLLMLIAIFLIKI